MELDAWYQVQLEVGCLASPSLFTRTQVCSRVDLGVSNIYLPQEVIRKILVKRLPDDFRQFNHAPTVNVNVSQVVHTLLEL